MEASWYRRYLRMLGLEDLEETPPSLESLNRIVRSHRHMPFESISSLQRRYRAGLVGPVASLNLDERLGIWERRAGGGVCYEFGAMLGALLDHLGRFSSSGWSQQNEDGQVYDQSVRENRAGGRPSRQDPASSEAFGIPAHPPTLTYLSPHVSRS